MVSFIQNVIDNENSRSFFLISLQTCHKSLNDINSQHCFVWLLMYYLPHLFSSDLFTTLTSSLPYKFCIWIYEFFKILPRRRVFLKVNLSNLENVLQKNLRAGRAREGIFRAFGGTIFENAPARHQPWWCLRGFNLCTCQPKKFWIHHWIAILDLHLM